MEHILNEVRNFIEKNNLISKNDKVGCAFSGGTDSVFMTYILNKLSYEMNFKVIAIHVNHMLRGEFSLRDENFSKNFCKLNCIEFKSYEVDVKKYSLDNKISIEMAGRFLRYDIFENLKNRGIINKCALAHHADDDVETILMRIFRGTGIKGIEGIKEIRNDFYIRPILFLRRKDHIEKFLNDNSIKYMTDDSNFSEDYLRNKLRLNIIPAINENFSMDITNSILNLKEMSKTDNDFFEKLVKIYLEKYVEFRFNEVLIRNECFKLHNSILFRLIRTTIEIFSGDINDINLKHVKCIVESFNLKFGGKIQIRKRLYCIKDLCGLKFVNSISNLNENSEESHVLLNKIEISNSEEENKETNQNEDAISIEEHKLLKNFNKLNKTGKDEAIKRVEELTYINKYIDANETKVDENSSYLNPVAAHDDNLTIEEKNRMDEIILKKLKELGKL